MKVTAVRVVRVAFVALAAVGASCASKATLPSDTLDAESIATLTLPDSLTLAAVEWRALEFADTSITPIRSGAIQRDHPGFRDLPLKALLADRSIWRVPTASDLKHRYGYHARFKRHGVSDVDLLAGEDIVAVARDGRVIIVADVPWGRAFNSVPMHEVNYIE